MMWDKIVYIPVTCVNRCVYCISIEFKVNELRLYHLVGWCDVLAGRQCQGDWNILFDRSRRWGNSALT